MRELKDLAVLGRRFTLFKSRKALLKHELSSLVAVGDGRV